MNILLLAQQTFVSETVKTMLESADDWSVIKASSLDSLTDSSSPEDSKWDIIVANLADFSKAPTQLIRKIRGRYPATPLLVMYSYNQELLIHPLINAGATGYLQNGIPEQGLLKAIEEVAAGEEFIMTESTY